MDPNSADGKRLFQLPSLPPWKTPQFKDSRNRQSQIGSSGDFTTPLRRPKRPLLQQLVQQEQEQSEVNIDDIIEDMVGVKAKKTRYDNIPYNYHPFIDKAMIRQNKMNNFLQSERAVHCLIFHKEGHSSDNFDEYRPDIDWNCGDDRDTALDKRSLITSLPNCNEAHLNDLLDCQPLSHDPMDFELESIDDSLEISPDELDLLQEFWGGSKLVWELELDKIKIILNTLRHERQVFRALKEIPKLPPFKTPSLKEKCHSIYEEDSFVAKLQQRTTSL